MAYGLGFVVDLADDLRDKVLLSFPVELDSLERKDGVDEEKVLDLEVPPNIELLFICSV